MQTQIDAMNHPNTQFDLRIPKAGQYFSVLDEWAQQALAGTLSAQEALNGAAKAWQGITEDAGLETQKKMYRDLYGI